MTQTTNYSDSDKNCRRCRTSKTFVDKQSKQLSVVCFTYRNSIKIRCCLAFPSIPALLMPRPYLGFDYFFSNFIILGFECVAVVEISLRMECDESHTRTQVRRHFVTASMTNFLSSILCFFYSMHSLHSLYSNTNPNSFKLRSKLMFGQLVALVWYYGVKFHEPRGKSRTLFLNNNNNN